MQDFFAPRDEVTKPVSGLTSGVPTLEVPPPEVVDLAGESLRLAAEWEEVSFYALDLARVRIPIEGGTGAASHAKVNMGRESLRRARKEPVTGEQVVREKPIITEEPTPLEAPQGVRFKWPFLRRIGELSPDAHEGSELDQLKEGQVEMECELARRDDKIKVAIDHFRHRDVILAQDRMDMQNMQEELN
ncbi:uncharacterized protein A4U43_C08F22800 [Asparagus officinalis]|nr:uncharacterized protein A4U43_C08F22800 [Asparagus officinalis]